MHLNMGADNLLWPSLANDFTSALKCSYFWNTIEMSASSMTCEFMHNNEPRCEQEGSPPGSGSKEFPGLTPKCLYAQKSVHLFHIHPSSICPLQMVHAASLQGLNICVGCAHASVCACVSTYVLRGLISGWGLPYWPVSKFLHPPRTNKLSTHSDIHKHTHTLDYLSTEVCTGLEQSLIGESQWGIKRQVSPSADWPTSPLCSGCWLIDCVTHVLPRLRPAFHHHPKWTQWRHAESTTLLLRS